MSRYKIVVWSLQLSAVASVLGFATGCSNPQTSPVPFYTQSDLTPVWLSDTDAAAIHRIPDFTLTDQSGTEVTQADLDGHLTVASFFFTSCGQVCPILRSKLSTLQAEYLDDARVTLVSHSVSPEADSVSVLARYAEANGVVDGKWRLLTGARDELYRLAREGYFVDVDTGAGDTPGTDLIHTETVVLLDGQRRIRGVYSGTVELEMMRLREDMSALLAEG